jgi:hypothetical protein
VPWLHLRDGGEGAPEDEGDGHGRDGGVGIDRLILPIGPRLKTCMVIIRLSSCMHSWLLILLQYNLSLPTWRDYFLLEHYLYCVLII